MVNNYGYLNERSDLDFKVHSSSLQEYDDIYEIWSLTSSGYLKGATTGRILVTDGTSIFTQLQQAPRIGTFPYKCTQGETISPLYGQDAHRGRRGTELNCVANGKFRNLYVCLNGDLEAAASGCSDGMSPQHITTLYLSEPPREFAGTGHLL